MTEPRTETRVPIPGTTNVRDLGGYPARPGTRIRARRLYRSEALVPPGSTAKTGQWADENRAAYEALGLKTVIDLRAPNEIASGRSVWHEASGARLVHLPINEGGEGDQTDFVHQMRAGTLRSFGAEDLARYYASTVRARARTFGKILEELAAPAALPALVHCTAGKDRTGILVALLLEVLGTPRETVVSDYALTGIFRPNRVAAYADILGASGIEPAAVSALFDTPPATMRSLLGGIDAEFGSVRAFLHERAGVDAGAMDRLAEELLEPGE